ncbi:MAG: carbon monoxide dehydrogenase subunit G [Pseudomonadota bacterium]
MELNGERTIPASVDKTWAALNDPEVLKACIAGCESLERTAEDKMTAVVALKVGPVSARFKGNIAMTNVDAPNGYTLNFDGQGGVAGFGKGSADVALTAVSPEQTLLKYTARATVGGKMAQIGSRLIDATAGKITEDFFKAFEAHLQASAAPVAAGDAVVAAPAPGAAPASDGSISKLWWLIGGVVVLAIVYFAIR